MLIIFFPRTAASGGTMVLNVYETNNDKRGIVVIAPGSMLDVTSWKSSTLGKRPPDYRNPQT
jgi:all-trans-retinol 13,14-reductase